MSTPTERLDATPPADNPPTHTQPSTPSGIRRVTQADSTELAYGSLATLRSAQVDTSAARNDLGAFTGIYSLIIVLALAGVMTWSALRGIGLRLDLGAFVADPQFIAAGTLFTSLGVCTLLATASGPLGASKPVRSWLASTPADRAVLLAAHVRSVGLLTGGISATASAFAVAVQHGAPLLMLSAAIVGFTFGYALVLFLAADQKHPISPRRATAFGSVTLGIGALALILGVLPGWSTVSQLRSNRTADDMYELARDVLLIVVGLIAIRYLTSRARASARSVPIGALSRGGDFVDSLGIATLMLDSTQLRGVINLFTSPRRRTVHRLRHTGLRAVVEMDQLTLRRRSYLRGLLFVSLPIPATVAALLGGTLGWVAALLTAYLVAIAHARSLVTWTRSDSLRRTLPFAPWKIRLALLAWPTLITAVWALAALALARIPLDAWPTLMLAVTAATLISADPRDSATAASGMLYTPMGVIPLGLIMLLFRGIDLLILPALLGALGFHLAAALVAAVPLLYLLVRRPKI